MHTNAVSLAAINAAGHAQQSLSVANQRLSTGYRINSGQDDAAGLQIATRLHAENSGMKVAMRNTQNSISKLQTTDSVLESLNNSLLRMQELATQAADASYSDDDRQSMQKEYDQLGRQNERLAKDDLLYGENGLLTGKATNDFNTRFQFGSSAEESTQYQFERLYNNALQATQETSGVNVPYQVILPHNVIETRATDTGGELLSVGGANAVLSRIADAIGLIAQSRSELGGLINRLDHTFSNLQTASQNGMAAEGRYMDADFADETATATAQLMLLQSSTAMMRKSNVTPALVISLLQ
jgi:flagellin